MHIYTERERKEARRRGRRWEVNFNTITSILLIQTQRR
jgi:hypothetical protein